MSLSEEDLNALVEKLKPALTEPKVEPKAEPSLVEQLAELMDRKSKEANSQVFETLWEDQLSNLYSKTKGFEDFLSEEDDYGAVRIERLKNMPYEERVATAKKLESQYRNALSNGTAKAPRVDPKTQELAESNEKRYNEVEKKLDNNEYSSIDELQNDMFAAISNELGSLMQ